MKHVKFVLDHNHSMMSRAQATEIEKEFNVHLDFNIYRQVWELILLK